MYGHQCLNAESIFLVVPHVEVDLVELVVEDELPGLVALLHTLQNTYIRW